MRLRPGLPEDHDAYLDISLRTALHGEDGTAYYRDGALMGLIYSAPYLTTPGAFALSLEIDGAVVGFAVGALDTVAFEATLEREWWPDLRSRYPADGTTDATTGMEDARRLAQIHNPRQTPDEICTRWPAHMHLNLAPEAQGRGLGTPLRDAWLTEAAAQGARAVHVGVNRKNTRGARFWRRGGFNGIDFPEGHPAAATLWLGRELPR